MIAIFKGLTGAPELTRMVGASAAIIFPFPYIYAVIAKGVIPEPAAFGQGYALTLAAIGVMIGAKDYGVGKATSLVQGGSDATPTT